MRLFLWFAVFFLFNFPIITHAEEGKVSANKEVLWHFVAFRFKDDEASQRQIPSMIKKYEKLKELSVDSKDPSRHLIKTFIYGKNTNPEQLSFLAKGVPHDRRTEYGFILTFENEADRDEYVNKDPHHQQFKKEVIGLLDGGPDGVFVIDFTAPPPSEADL